MYDGEILQRFIDSQTIRKVKIASDLGMTKQNLYGLFKSKALAPETKERFEKYFGKSIFTKEAIDQMGKEAFEKIASKMNSKHYLPMPEFNQDSALIHLLVLEVSKLKAASLGVDPSVIVAEFYRNAMKEADILRKEREGGA